MGSAPSQGLLWSLSEEDMNGLKFTLGSGLEELSSALLRAGMIGSGGGGRWGGGEALPYMQPNLGSIL